MFRAVIAESFLGYDRYMILSRRKQNPLTIVRTAVPPRLSLFLFAMGVLVGVDAHAGMALVASEAISELRLPDAYAPRRDSATVLVLDPARGDTWGLRFSSTVPDRLDGLRSANLGERADGLDSDGEGGTAFEPNRLSANRVGMEWHQRWDASNAFRLAARYGDYQYDANAPRRTNAYGAALAWDGRYRGDAGPRLGGSLFVGEETPEDGAPKFLGRRYYGVTAAGQFSPFKDHTPFLALKLQRNSYDDPESQWLNQRNEAYARLAAGWDWQVLPNWRLRAQADYTANKFNTPLYDYDASRLFFSTRFDFR